jgi:hypothetical protein
MKLKEKRVVKELLKETSKDHKRNSVSLLSKSAKKQQKIKKLVFRSL